MEPTKMTPRDFFFNITAVATLYVSAVSFLNLLFEIINRLFPDALSDGYYNYGYYSTSIRLAIASLLIIFPLYIFISWRQNKEFEVSPVKKELGIRRWLTYLTLFLASATIVVDLITLLNTFLNGEITTRFIFKILAVLVVAGIIFGYYMYDLRGKVVGAKGTKTFAIIVGCIVLGGIVGGFLIIGSPMRERLIRFDERKIGDLSNIQSQILNYRQNKGMLPATLPELNDSISGYSVPVDPQTSVQYEYSHTGELSFKLCADFNLSTEDINTKDYKTKSRYPSSVMYE